MAGAYWYTDSSGKRKRTAAGVRREYDLFQSSTKAKKARAARNSARRSALKDGRVSVGDNKDVHHLNGTSDNEHTKVLPRSANRGMSEKSRLKGSKRSARKKKR